MDTTSSNNLAIQPRTGTQGSGGTNGSSKVRYAGLNYYSLPPTRLFTAIDQALKNSSGILKVFFDQEGLRDWARSKEAGIVALVPENDSQDTTHFMDFTILLHESMAIYTDTVLSIRLCEQYHGFRSNKPHILLRTLFYQILNQLDPVERTGLDLATSNATFHYSFELITGSIKDALGLLPKNKRPYIFLHDL
ncbi:hypothetical protein BS50DRAFT_654753 [Corynespora cassiicola Philippines]|uniref:Uncharacterized protein n=1 Tax=Corynespora cassiicola Philippines TaxID=1448308 RepID=A0A2T2N5Q8_CORCC|nr:hypothetical protein BS50DRAFT_654753 [Corynespora cassiicola Philippines]